MNRVSTSKNVLPWPHRVAWVLACATFPLIWMGGLVTTYGAGMAVPDWPNTYGYNLFLYPLASWLGVWDVFLEHSHRLIGAAVGMITLILAGLLWRQEERRWLRWLGVVAILGVCFQGTLGGLRVIGDELLLANVHGCTAPLFFSLTVAMVVFTSARWQRAESVEKPVSAGRLPRFAVAATLGVYLQIVLGAQLRHLPPATDPLWFAVWTWAHVIVAALVLVGLVWLAVAVMRRAGQEPLLARRARLVLWMIVIQVLLGLATWVTNFGFPAWFADYIWDVEYTVVAQGRLQALVTTAHVGVGSLSLVATLSLTLWLLRLSSGAGASGRVTATTGHKCRG
jgi:cytochrome c oxidase assembly protein subunit 15